MVRISLALVKATTREELTVCFRDALVPACERWGVEVDAEHPGSTLSTLVRAAPEPTGQEVVLLIDEYDAPLLTVVHDAARLQEFREVMPGFYAPIKDLGEVLRFVLLAGFSRFSQLSVFSELNNLRTSRCSRSTRASAASRRRSWTASWHRTWRCWQRRWG